MKAISLLVAAGVAAAGLAIAPATAEAQVIKIDGSSTVFPITEAVAEEFQIMKRGKVRVTVGISGTGGGFKKFCRGETDVAGRVAPDPERGNGGLPRGGRQILSNCRSPTTR